MSEIQGHKERILSHLSAARSKLGLAYSRGCFAAKDFGKINELVLDAELLLKEVEEHEPGHFIKSRYYDQKAEDAG